MIANLDFSRRTTRRIESGRIRKPELHNLRFKEKESHTQEEIPSIGKSFTPNKIGVYNLIGNVAEMVEEKGIAKGGAWVHNKDDVKIETNFNYTKPKKWLGFRCVCERVRD